MSLAVPRRPLFATRRSRTISFGVAVTGVSVAAAILTTAEPTGLARTDAFWSGLLVAVLSVFGATARRWTWFMPAGLAALVAGDGLAVALAAVAIAVAFVSVVKDSRSRARGALVAGLGGVALLRADPVGFHGLTAILATAAMLPVVISGYMHAGRRVQARARRIALLAAGTIGLMMAGAALGVVSVRDDLADGVRAIDSGMEAARDADEDAAAAQLGQASRSLTAADSVLTSWFVAPAKSLPVVGPNLDAIGSLAAQASEVAEVTSLAANQADVDALRFVDGRLDPEVVADMQQPLERVREALERMGAEVDEARSPWLVRLVSSRVDLLDEEIDELVPDAETAINAVSAAPKLLGSEGPQRYLVLFTTPVEARGRLGFPGNYAELVVDDGRLTMPVFGRVADLEQAGAGTPRRLDQSPEMMSRYGRFDITNTWRNLTMTPDFVSFALAAGELYPQSGGQPIDGVLAIDPKGLAALMRYTGEVQVPGVAEPLGADNAENFLLLEQYVRFEADNDARLDMLDAVARTTFERLTTADLPGPRALSDQLDPVVDGGHIQFATFAQDTFLSLQVAGVTGLVGPLDGTDGVMVTTANAGGNKIDLFLERREQYDVTWNPETGQVSGTLRVTLENNAPTEGWPDYVIGNAVGLPTGTNRSFVSIYSPFEMTASRVNGQPAPLQAEVELGRNVYSTFVDIPPGGTVDVEVDLTGQLEGRRYELVLPSQPAVQPDEITVDLEVVGGGAIVSREAKIEGNTANWSSTLDLPRTLTVSAPRP